MLRLTVAGLCLACLLLTLPGIAATAPRAVVVLPRNPTPVERFAADELQRCLKLSPGLDVRLALAPAAKDALTFWVGTEDRLRPVPAALVLKRAPALADDGVCLLSQGNDIVLAGKGARGALNAVYTFLERCVGFHWPEPGREFVPPARPLQLDQLEIVSNPAFAYRGIAIHGRCGAEWFAQILDWLSKNRMNAFQIFPGHYEQVRPTVLPDILKRGLYPNIGGHSREFFFANSKYFAPHPEWFALVKGKRVPESQICYSDLSSVPEYAANIVAYLKSRPEIGMASLWPSDGYGFCECDKCKAGPTTDIIVNYCNALTSEVVKAVPEAETEFLSYIHYTIPPQQVKLVPQMVPTYCEYWSRSQFHPITDDRSGNAKCRQELQGWIAASKQVTLFSYYGDDCIKRFVYNPLMDMIGADMKFYRTIKLAGNFVLLTNPESWWSHAPHLYAYTKAAWDPDTPVAAMASAYYDGLYGPAASAMRAHAAASRALFDLKTAQGVTGEDILWGQSWGCTDREKIAQTRQQGLAGVATVRECLAQARAANSDPWVLERVRKLEADADYLAWLFDFAAEVQLAKIEKTPEAYQRLVALAGKGLQLEVIAEDDRQGYRSARNSLLSTTRVITGQEPSAAYGTPKQLREYEQSGIWRWVSSDIVPSTREKPRRMLVDVTDRIKEAGTYTVTWQYLEGADGLFIISTGLYSAPTAQPKPEDLTEIALDKHDGFTGGGNSLNVYTLRLPQRDPALHYFVQGLIWDEREFDTYGHVLSSKQ